MIKNTADTRFCDLRKLGDFIELYEQPIKFSRPSHVQTYAALKDVQECSAVNLFVLESKNTCSSLRAVATSTVGNNNI